MSFYFVFFSCQPYKQGGNSVLFIWKVDANEVIFKKFVCSHVLIFYYFQFCKYKVMRSRQMAS